MLHDFKIKFTPSQGVVTVNISYHLNSHGSRSPFRSKVEVRVIVRFISLLTLSFHRFCFQLSDGLSVGTLRFEVVDSGAGISAMDQKRIFGEFAQFNRDELQGGGLSFCLTLALISLRH